MVSVTSIIVAAVLFLVLLSIGLMMLSGILPGIDKIVGFLGNFTAGR